MWAAQGGALIGALCVTVVSLVESYLRSGGDPVAAQIVDWLGAFVVGTVMAGAFSLLFVIPCTLLFGLPAALLVRKLEMRRWPALGVCIGLALVAQVAAGLTLWQIEQQPTMFLLATPFSMSAAVVLWWRLSPPA
jgi:hypothetical protein